MTIIKLSTGTRTATAATDSYTFTNVIGQVKAVEITNSASTDYKAYSLQDNGSSVGEYIIGASGAVLTVATYDRFNVRINAEGPDSGAIAGVYVEPAVRGSIKIDVTNLTAADTWSVNIYLENNE